MSVKGNVRKDFVGFEKYIGLIQIQKIVAVNPTIEERAKLYGKELDDDAEEIEYVTETDEGDKKVFIDFYYETTKPELGVKRYRVTMVNTNRVTEKEKEVDGETVKETRYQFVNQIGLCTWSDDEDNLPEWFVSFLNKDKEVVGEKRIRKALEGEELLMNFLRALFKMRWWEVDADLTYDYKKIFKGDMKEIKADVMREDITQPFVGLLHVETSEDGEKQYEKLYGKFFLPAGIIKFVNNGKKFANDWDKKLWNKFEEEVTGEWGPKGATVLEEARLYDRDEDITAQNTTKKKEPVPTDSEY